MRIHALHGIRTSMCSTSEAAGEGIWPQTAGLTASS
jgi:hypothetical protein